MTTIPYLSYRNQKAIVINDSDGYGVIISALQINRDSHD